MALHKGGPAKEFDFWQECQPGRLGHLCLRRKTPQRCKNSFSMEIPKNMRLKSGLITDLRVNL